jgi:crossover junction endodeoxyribonuclease RuvC
MVVTATFGAVVGLDLSLTGAGIAVEHEGQVEVSVEGAKGRDGEPVTVRHRRIIDQSAKIATYITSISAQVDLVVTEGPSYSSKGGKPHDRAGLWWRTIGYFLDRGVEVVVVEPTLLKRFGAQTGNASKLTMIAKAIKRYPDVEIVDDNAADAAFLLEIGRRLASYGRTAGSLDDLPPLAAVSQKALDDIHIAALSARRGR